MLSAGTFDRLMRMWDMAAQRPMLIFVGDFAQLRGVEPSRATDSHRWQDVRKVWLHTMRRCECDELRWKLELLRTAKPTVHQLRDIMKNHKAPSRMYRAADRMNPEPTPEDVAWIFTETPDTKGSGSCSPATLTRPTTS
jgi:hypothetical protein